MRGVFVTSSSRFKEVITMNAHTRVLAGHPTFNVIETRAVFNPYVGHCLHIDGDGVAARDEDLPKATLSLIGRNGHASSHRRDHHCNVGHIRSTASSQCRTRGNARASSDIINGNGVASSQPRVNGHTGATQPLFNRRRGLIGGGADA
jgi:hypothetical protein